MSPVLSRVRYAAIEAVGGRLGAVLSRTAANTGAGIGALVGTTIGEKRVEVTAVVENARGTGAEE
jgi:hypothetical protein